MDKANGHLTYLKYDLEDEQAPVYEVLKKDIRRTHIYVKDGTAEGSHHPMP